MIRIDQSNDGTPQAVYDDAGHRISLAALLAAHRDVLILKDYAERLQADAERREREIARLRTLLAHWQRYGATMQRTSRELAEQVARLKRRTTARGCFAIDAAERSKR